MRDQNKVEKFFVKELASELSEVFIVDYDDGSYELFNKYRVEPQTTGLFKVVHFTVTEEHMFSSKKHAFTWCIFDKYKKIKESNRIEELDLLLSGLEVSMAQQKKLLAKAKDNDTKLIYLAKLQEAKRKRNAMIKEINSYINISRHWQSSKFTNKQPK
jgi:hypothetical protein